MRPHAGKLLAGFLVTAAPASADGVVIAALGDSLVHGYGLAQDAGFVPQLNRWLSTEGIAAEVRNAGVSGDTSTGGLARLDWTLTPEVDGLIVVLGGNDLLRGIDPATTRANIEGIVTGAAARGVEVLLVGMQAPGNYGPDYKAAFDAIYPEVAEAAGAALHPSFLGPLARMEDQQATLRDYMQGDAIHPNAAGVALIVEEIGPAVAALAAQVQSE